MDENRDQQADDHFKHHREDGEFNGVQDRLAEIAVLKQVDIVFEPDEFGSICAFEILVVGKAVDKGKDQGIGRQDGHHQQGRCDHQARERALAQMGRPGARGQ